MKGISTKSSTGLKVRGKFGKSPSSPDRNGMPKHLPKIRAHMKNPFTNPSPGRRIISGS